MKWRKKVQTKVAETPEDTSQTGSIVLQGTDTEMHATCILENALELAKSAAKGKDVTVVINRWPDGVDPQQVILGLMSRGKDYGLMFRYAFDTQLSFKQSN